MQQRYKGWWTLPGPSAVVQRMLRDFRSGISVIVREPQWLPSGFVSQARARVRQEGFFRWIDIEVGADGAIDQPVGRIAAACGVTDEVEIPHSVRGLARAEWIQHHLVQVDLTSCSSDCDSVAAWIDFFEQWRAAALDVRPEERAILLVRCAADSQWPLPPSDTASRLLALDDCSESMDLQMHVYLQRGGTSSTGLRRRLEDALCASLAAGDPLLADALLQLTVEQLIDPGSHLQQFADGRDWTLSGTENPESQRDAKWAEGKCVKLGGVDVDHSAWLQVLGNSAEIEHRVWSAQLRVIFPAIEKWRVEFLQRHLSRFPKSADPFDMEVGPLIHYMRDHNIQIGDRGDWRCLRLVRDVRNQLAHFTPVEPMLLEELLRISDL